MARRDSKGGFGVIRTLNLLAFLPLASRAPIYGRLLWALAADPRVPASRKALLGLAAAYLVSPVDLIPDRIPFIGALDDVAVVVLAVDGFLAGVPDGLIDEKLVALGVPRSELEADLDRVRKVVPRPLREAAARLPAALDGVAEFIGERGLDARLRQTIMPRLSANKEEMPA
ncbi:MAG TPA: DUF1232 domain-containing protein [Candidatus Limnocylindria bacterium]|jgi:hypothetical protein|nr:DUF1232 domain-containing protein [Candidatus Limnocylindria bacterium]